jgi:hypothetical protein
LPIREDLRVDIDGPRNGWVAVTIVAGRRRYAFDGSFTPNDSIADLASALIAVATIETTTRVFWNEEPAQHVFELARTGEEVRLALTARSDEPASSFTFDGSLERVVGPFLAALEHLQHRQRPDAYAREWRHPFPETAVQRLRAALGP